MIIITATGSTHSVVEVNREFSRKNGAAPDEATPLGTEAADATPNSEGAVRKTFQNLRAELERRGMEVSFSVDPSSGFAQMVVIESGTGREVLKVPSDSTLYQALKDRTISPR